MKLLKRVIERLISRLRVKIQTLKKITPKHQMEKEAPKGKNMEEALRDARKAWDREQYSDEQRPPDQCVYRDENVPRWEPDKPNQTLFGAWAWVFREIKDAEKEEGSKPTG